MKQNKPDRICFFNSTRAWGGGEKWHFEIASRLHDLGYKILFIAGYKSDLTNRLSRTTIPAMEFSIRNLSFLNPFKIIRLTRLFRNENISVIILNLSADLKTAGIAAHRAGIKRIIYRRGSAIPVRNTILNRWLFSKVVTDIIANSEATKRTLLQNNSNLFPGNKIKVIYNGLKPEVYSVRNKKELLKVPPGTCILGHAGRMVYQKGHEYLINIAAVLKQKGIRFTLLLAGSGPLENKIRDQVRNLGLENEVVFLSFVEDMVSFMQTIDIFLLPSRWEGFGFVLAEAMIQKKPVVAFDISSNPELVHHGKNGFLAAAFNTEEFSNYLITLIKNPQLQTDFGNKGFEMVQEKFLFDRTIKEVLEFIQ